MRPTRRATVGLLWTWLAILLAAVVVPAGASAQTAPQRPWAVVPQLGFAIVRDNGSWGSGGMEAALELEHGGADWRWSGSGSLRGIGVGCSERCFQAGGPALALGGARSVGALWIGAGAAVLRQHGEWRLLPHGRVSLDAAPLRFDVRIELPRETGVSLYLPIMVGVPIRE